MFRIGPADDVSEFHPPVGFDHERVATPAFQRFRRGKAAKIAALAEGNQIFAAGLLHGGAFSCGGRRYSRPRYSRM